MAQAQTVGNKLIDKLNEAVFDNIPNDIVIAGLRKEANALLKVEPAEGYTVLGAIECVCGNTQAMIENHERARRIAPSDGFVLSNYASTLAISWMLEEQFDVLTEMFQKHINYAETLTKLSYNRAIYGDYETASQMSQRFLNEVRDADPYDVTEMKVTVKAYEFIKSVNLARDEVQNYASVMNEILKQERLIPSSLHEWLTPDNKLVRDIVLKVDDDKIAELNDRLIDHLIEIHFSDTFLSSFSGSFVPLN
jgi:tetratricopeptide (TPR) repeat protein